jgi:Holliday junction resolvase RusA-like endonuclease
VITFFVPGIAETKGSWRSFGKGRMVPDNPRAKAWETAVAWAAKVAVRQERAIGLVRGGEPTLELVTVRIGAYLPTMTDKRKDRDVDKLARAALDAMQGIVYANDKQVVELVIDKLRGVPGPIGMLVVVGKALSDEDRAEKYRGLISLPQ